MLAYFNHMNRFLIKLDRFAAWILMAVIIFYGYSAGIDLTDYFYSQHQASLLDDYPIVGAYQK